MHGEETKQIHTVERTMVDLTERIVLLFFLVEFIKGRRFLGEAFVSVC